MSWQSALEDGVDDLRRRGLRANSGAEATARWNRTGFERRRGALWDQQNALEEMPRADAARLAGDGSPNASRRGCSVTMQRALVGALQLISSKGLLCIAAADGEDEHESGALARPGGHHGAGPVGVGVALIGGLQAWTRCRSVAANWLDGAFFCPRPTTPRAWNPGSTRAALGFSRHEGAPASHPRSFF